MWYGCDDCFKEEYIDPRDLQDWHGGEMVSNSTGYSICVYCEAYICEDCSEIHNC